MRKLFFAIILMAFTFASISAQEGNLGKLVSIDADDARLSHVLSVLAEQSGFNIVTSTKLADESKIDFNTNSLSLDQMKDNGKKLSVHLENVPIEQAISLVVRAAGYSYEIIGNSILVAPSDDLNKEVGLESFAMELNYLEASKARSIISGFIGDASGTFISVDADRNQIVAVASQQTINEIKKMIAEIDRPAYQIVLETRIIEVSVNDAEKMGVDWSRINHLTTILAENGGSINGYGIAYGNEGLSNDDFGSERFTRGVLPEEMHFQKIDGFDNVGHFSRQLTAFDITIDWLLKNNCAKVLTNTRLTTINNRSANIHIGERVPYAVTTAEDITVESENAGMEVTITPMINKDGYITTHIEPKLSSVLELIGGTMPRTMERTASTTVIAKDGEKITIAGLLNSETVKTDNKVPFFSDIPFIGDFFIHTEESIKKTDLVIEIIPHIIKHGETYADDIVLDDKMESRLLNNEETDEGEENE